MATTNLNLNTLAGTEKLKSFPTPYNENMGAIDDAFGSGFGVGNNSSVDDELNGLGKGMAIIANGNTHAAITSGQFVYVRQHGSLSEGLYQATANISANGTLSGSNLTAVSSGGLNALNSKIVASGLSTGSNSLTTPSDTYMIYSGYITGSGNYIDVFIPCDTSRITSVTSVKLGSYATLFTPTTIVDISGSTATEYAKTSLGIYAEFATGSTLTSDKNRVASLRTTTVTIVCA